MITEQKLSQVGKEQYIAFVRLIGAVVAHKEHRKENAETEPEKIWLGNEPDARSEIIFKFDPNDDPRFIRIPGVKIDALWGSAEDKGDEGWKKWEQSISWLVDDFVLNDFMNQFGKHENCGNHTMASSLENALDFQKLLDGTTDRMNMRYWDVLVIPRMSAIEIEQYVDEVRSIGAIKLESEQNTKRTRLEFDEEIGVLSFGKNQYPFHRGKQQSRDKDRLALMKKLWPKRMRVGDKSSNNKISGSSIALELRFCKSLTEFESDKKMKEKLKNLIGGVNRSMKDNGIPAKIKTVGGVQLIELEK
ncbi:MAG: hypothetical protein Q7S47_02375 [bacterium]|nr:hypothetical protein [bacterium]